MEPGENPEAVARSGLSAETATEGAARSGLSLISPPHQMTAARGEIDDRSKLQKYTQNVLDLLQSMTMQVAPMCDESFLRYGADRFRQNEARLFKTPVRRLDPDVSADATIASRKGTNDD